MHRIYGSHSTGILSYPKIPRNIPSSVLMLRNPTPIQTCVAQMNSVVLRSSLLCCKRDLDTVQECPIQSTIIKVYTNYSTVVYHSGCREIAPFRKVRICCRITKSQRGVQLHYQTWNTVSSSALCTLYWPCFLKLKNTFLFAQPTERNRFIQS